MRKVLKYIFYLPYRAFLLFLVTLLLIKDKPIPEWFKKELQIDPIESEIYDY